MNSQCSSYPPYPNVCISLPKLMHNRMKCIFVHYILHNCNQYRRILYNNSNRIYHQNYMGRLNSGSWQKEYRFRSDLSRSALSKESFASTACNEGFQLNHRSTKPPLLHQYGRSHPLAQTKFSNRDPDPPGDPPWSSTLSNNSQTRIVPFTKHLADDPIGKEAEREITIIRRYQICH